MLLQKFPNKVATLQVALDQLTLEDEMDWNDHDGASVSAESRRQGSRTANFQAAYFRRAMRQSSLKPGAMTGNRNEKETPQHSKEEQQIIKLLQRNGKKNDSSRFTTSSGRR